MNIDEVITKIGQDNLNEFMKFMYGQTVGIKNGIIDYYDYDVDRFLENNLNLEGWE